jgi:DNA repair exonuclease SbcCD ATPase subunit
VRIDPDEMRRLRHEFGCVDDESTLERLIRSFHDERGSLEAVVAERDSLVGRNERLQAALEEAEKRSRLLEKERNVALKGRDLERERADSLRAELEELRTDPPVVERVVVRENHRTVDELRTKCHELEARLWEHLRREEELRSALSQLDALRGQVEEWKRTHHAVLVSVGPGPTDVWLEIVDSRSYFEHIADPEGFNARHGLKGHVVAKELPYRL